MLFKDGSVKVSTEFNYGSKVTQGSKYPLGNTWLRIVLAAITFLAQGYLCSQVIFKFEFFGIFEFIGYIFDGAASVSMLLKAAQFCLFCLMSFALFIYYFQSTSSHIMKQRLNVLQLNSAESNRKNLEIAKRVTYKVTKLFAANGFIRIHDLESRVVGPKFRSIRYQEMTVNTALFLNAQIEIQRLLQLIVARDDQGYKKYAEDLGYSLGDASQLVQGLRGDQGDLATVHDKIQEELTAFVRAWVHPKRDEAFYTFMKSQVDSGKTTEGFFNGHHNYRVIDACTPGLPTTPIQKEIANYFFYMQRKLFRQATLNDGAVMSKEKFLDNAINLAANFEHEVIKKFPAKQSTFTKIWQTIVLNLGEINAAANAVIFGCVCYELLVQLSCPQVLLYSLFMAAISAGYYMSISFTFPNVKKFIKILQYKKTPMHSDNHMAKFNIALGFMIGLTSGVFCYSKVIKLLTDARSPIYLLIKYLNFQAFYLAHIGTICWMIGSLLAVVTFIFAAMLYMNQCLKSQRSSYDRSQCGDWSGRISNIPWGRGKQEFLVISALIQAAIFKKSLFALPLLKFLGCLRWLIIAGVAFVWRQLFNNAYEKMVLGSGFASLMSVNNLESYSSDFFRIGVKSEVAVSDRLPHLKGSPYQAQI